MTISRNTATTGSRIPFAAWAKRIAATGLCPSVASATPITRITAQTARNRGSFKPRSHPNAPAVA